MSDCGLLRRRVVAAVDLNLETAGGDRRHVEVGPAVVAVDRDQRGAGGIDGKCPTWVVLTDYNFFLFNHME